MPVKTTMLELVTALSEEAESIDEVIATGDCDVARDHAYWQAIVDAYEAKPAPQMRAA